MTPLLRRFHRGARPWNYFFFPNGYSLAAGATVRIESYTGASSNPPAVLFWTSAALWNNAGGCAEPYTNGNVLVHSECYSSGCPQRGNHGRLTKRTQGARHPLHQRLRGGPELRHSI